MQESFEPCYFRNGERFETRYADLLHVRIVTAFDRRHFNKILG
ncbi:MAG: hypothetical protein RBR12_09205 [Sulfurospirillum cavolei]|nr:MULTISPECIES: hypothetical protein [Sulfurospirillum]MDY0265339.1 hypothetical protein [Sulfurospirillum cavolei]